MTLLSWSPIFSHCVPNILYVSPGKEANSTFPKMSFSYKFSDSVDESDARPERGKQAGLWDKSSF